MSPASRSGKKSSKKRIIRWILLGIAAVAAFGLFEVFGPNTDGFRDGEYLYIHTGANYQQVKSLLQEQGFIRDIHSFDFLAKQAGYPDHVHAGKYKISKGMSNYSIVRMLRSGRQTPVKLVINKLRTKAEFIHMLGANLEADSNVLKQMFADTVYLSQFGLDTNTVMCAVMPNTYQFYWNTSADKAFRKIEKSFATFWTDSRKQQAQDMNLTPQEVITVASIVEEETNNNPEKGNIASVYLNRLHNGTRLQADPTARFAYGDFTIHRITSVQTGFQSPYNTYLVKGLPPGPICTPSEKTIDAVLHAPKTTYLYFCAKGDGSGTHLFASTYDEHLKNARAYHQALDAQGIH
ncbi:endolytic transglycosylase MltG [Chitinophagaceae bacterium MMS25-I14]